MPKRYPPEFKRDVVGVARRGDLRVAEIAVDVAPESVRRWVRQADVDDGTVSGQTASDQAELAQPRQRMHRMELENDS